MHFLAQQVKDNGIPLFMEQHLTVIGYFNTKHKRT